MSDPAPLAETSTKPYNERLFGPGIRGWVHRSRFRWVGKEYRANFGSPPTVLEIGCHDGKTLEYLSPPPESYLGIDADWEGGLPIAEQRWAGTAWATFQQASTADEIPTGARFDLAISMETLEHVPDEILEGYIDRLAEITDDLVLISVPNEIGPVCLAKQTLKKLLMGGSRFSWQDIWNASLGRTDRIVRDDHRGFNYRKLIRRLNESFDVVSVRGAPMSMLPAYLNVTVCIKLKPRKGA